MSAPRTQCTRLRTDHILQLLARFLYYYCTVHSWLRCLVWLGTGWHQWSVTSVKYCLTLGQLSCGTVMLCAAPCIWHEFLLVTEAFLNGCAIINFQRNHHVPLFQQAFDQHHGTKCSCQNINYGQYRSKSTMGHSGPLPLVTWLKKLTYTAFSSTCGRRAGHGSSIYGFQLHADDLAWIKQYKGRCQFYLHPKSLEARELLKTKRLLSELFVNEPEAVAKYRADEKYTVMLPSPRFGKKAPQPLRATKNICCQLWLLLAMEGDYTIMLMLLPHPPTNEQCPSIKSEMLVAFIFHCYKQQACTLSPITTFGSGNGDQLKYINGHVILAKGSVKGAMWVAWFFPCSHDNYTPRTRSEWVFISNIFLVMSALQFSRQPKKLEYQQSLSLPLPWSLEAGHHW